MTTHDPAPPPEADASSEETKRARDAADFWMRRADDLEKQIDELRKQASPAKSDGLLDVLTMWLPVAEMFVTKVEPHVTYAHNIEAARLRYLMASEALAQAALWAMKHPDSDLLALALERYRACEQDLCKNKPMGQPDKTVPAPSVPSSAPTA